MESVLQPLELILQLLANRVRLSKALFLIIADTSENPKRSSGSDQASRPCDWPTSASLHCRQALAASGRAQSLSI